MLSPQTKSHPKMGAEKKQNEASAIRFVTTYCPKELNKLGWVKAEPIKKDLEELIDSYRYNDELDWRGVVNDLVSIIAMDLVGDNK